MYQIIRGDSYFEGRGADSFHTYLELKRRGYKDKYKKNILTLDQYDFIATYYILFRVDQHGRNPLMVQRYLSKKRCEYFGLEFPMDRLIQSNQKDFRFENYRKFIEKVIDNDIIYPSSFTVDPGLIISKKEKDLFIELTAMYHYLESQNYKTSFFLTSAVKKFKTYRVLEMAGHQFLEVDALKKTNFNNEEVLLMGTSQISSFCFDCFRKHHMLLDEGDELAA
jgi:hypothetical protein